MQDNGIDSFNREAIAFMRERLQEGKTFAHHLLHRPGLTQGRVLAFLSEGILLEGPFSGGRWDFESGSVGAPLPKVDQGIEVHDLPWRWFPSGEEDEGLTIAVQGWLAEGRIGLLEDPVRGPADADLDGLGTRIVRSGDEVYHLLLPQDGLGAIRAALAAADWRPFLGALVPDARRWHDLHRGEATQEELALVAQSADHILVGAYDDEGYLIWTAPTSAG